MVFDISGLLSLRVIMIAQGPTGGALAGSAASSANSSLRPNRPDFDGAVFAERELLGPLDGFVLRVALDQIEAPRTSLVSAKGPSVTCHCPALSRTRLPSWSERKRSVK